MNDDSDNLDEEQERKRKEDKLGEAYKAAATYAWEHFKMHAQQRQAVFRFYVLMAGAIFAA